MWTVEPEKFVQALKVLDMIPAVPGLPSSTLVRLHEIPDGAGRSLELSITGAAAGIVTVTGKEPLMFQKPIYIDRSLLFPFILSAEKYKSSKPFELGGVRDRIIVVQGRRKATFQYVTKGTGYLAPSSMKGGVMLSMTGGFAGMLKAASSCAFDEDVRPELNCVYLDGDEVYATNELVAFVGKYKEGKRDVALALPLFIINLLAGNEIQMLRVKEKEVVAQFECGCIWQSVSDKALKHFPLEIITKLVNDGRKWPEQFEIATWRLKAVVDRFSNYLNSVDKKNWLMFIKGEDGASVVTLEAKVSQGVFREKVPVEAAIKGSFAIDWPLAILLPVFDYMANDKDLLRVRFGKETPYLLSAGPVSVVVTRRKQ